MEGRRLPQDRIACVPAAVSFYLKVHDSAAYAVPILAISGILLFSAGVGAVPWVVVAQIFLINLKGVAGEFAPLLDSFGAWAVSDTFNCLMSWNSYGTFILYAAINAIAKRKTLGQTQPANNL